MHESSDKQSRESDLEGDENRSHLHQCPLCDYSSPKRCNLTRHMKIHESDKQSSESDLEGDVFEAEEVKIEPDPDAAE